MSACAIPRSDLPIQGLEPKYPESPNAREKDDGTVLAPIILVLAGLVIIYKARLHQDKLLGQFGG
jgi:hypothetical protein